VRKNIPVSTIMTKEVITAHVAQPLSEVRKLITDNDFHHIPIVSGESLVGMITASDILGLSVEGIGSDQRAMDAYLDHQFSVESVMRKELKTIPTDSTIRDAAEILATGEFHAVPVVSDNSFAGIVTSTDLIRFLRDQF